MASLSNAYCDPFSSWGGHVISRPSTGAALHEQAAAEELCAHDALQPEWAVGNGIIGSSPALVQILDQVKTVAPLDSTVLIQGETGTRQGAYCKCNSQPKHPEKEQLRSIQLRRGASRPAEGRTFRSRERCLHWRSHSQTGPVRTRRQGNSVLRRNRRYAAGTPGQAAARAENHAIPTIFITAHSDERLRSQTMRAGTVKFLTKPFDCGTLLEGVRDALDMTADPS